jgi:hypothetical protein
MLIFGIHRILIGIFDFGLEKFFHISDITHNWYECIILAIAIETILLPIIIYSQRNYPILLGKKH